MHCPRTNDPLVPEHEGLHEDILVFRCPCSMLWMPPESLDRLDDNIDVDASRLSWAPAPQTSAFQCPACSVDYRGGSPMLQPQSLELRTEIVIHRCPRCRWVLLEEATLDAIRGIAAGLEVPEVVF